MLRFLKTYGLPLCLVAILVICCFTLCESFVFGREPGIIHSFLSCVYLLLWVANTIIVVLKSKQTAGLMLYPLYWGMTLIASATVLYTAIFPSDIVPNAIIIASSFLLLPFYGFHFFLRSLYNGNIVFPALLSTISAIETILFVRNLHSVIQKRTKNGNKQ